MWNFTSRVFIGRETHSHCVGSGGHEGPNAQEKAECLMAATVHLLEDVMDTYPSTWC